MSHNNLFNMDFLQGINPNHLKTLKLQNNPFIQKPDAVQTLANILKQFKNLKELSIKFQDYDSSRYLLKQDLPSLKIFDGVKVS